MISETILGVFEVSNTARRFGLELSRGPAGDPPEVQVSADPGFPRGFLNGKCRGSVVHSATLGPWRHRRKERRLFPRDLLAGTITASVLKTKDEPPKVFAPKTGANKGAETVLELGLVHEASISYACCRWLPKKKEAL